MKYKSYLNKFRNKPFFFRIYESGSIKAIVQSSAKIILVQVLAAALLFAGSYIIIKLSDAASYGSYVSVMAWVSFFSVIAVFGFDDYFIAVLPKIYFVENGNKSIQPILVRALITVVGAFSLLSIVLATLFYFNFFEPPVQENKVYFYLLLLEVSILAVLIAFFRGINNIVPGQVVDKLARPALMILFVILVYLMFGKINVSLLLFVQLAVLLVVILYMALQVKRHFPSLQVPPKILDKSLQLNASFLLISILNLLSVRLDILFLTKTVLPEQVGYYNLGVRMADIIGFPLAAMNLVVPTFLAKETANNLSGIKKLITNSAIIALGATLVIYAPVVVFGRFILPLFGKQFIQGYIPMVILGATYLVSSLSHQVNGYLMISGNQKFSLVCLVINVVAVFIFCCLLVPVWGLAGAAFSVLSGSIIYLVAILFFYKKVMSE